MLIGPILHNGSSVITQNLTFILEANQTYSLMVQVKYGSHIIATNTHPLGENYSTNNIYTSIYYALSDTFVDLTGCKEYSITTTSMFTLILHLYIKGFH